MAARAIISKTWLISLHAKDTSIDIILAENKALKKKLRKLKYENCVLKNCKGDM